ncbi:hypothetical protein [Halolamina sp. CBA1230]|nr:hypothetical protein [Halolamina sp. CBA1230]
MSSFETYDCVACDTTFRAYPDANATEGPYCSPACESDAKNLA